MGYLGLGGIGRTCCFCSVYNSTGFCLALLFLFVVINVLVGSLVSCSVCGLYVG